MDFFIYILILMLFIGAFLIIYGSISMREADNDSDGDGQQMLSLAKKLDTLETSVYEADEAVHMLGDMSKNVFKEFDSKYQELLFLYNLVDEKQKTLTTTDGTQTAPTVQKPKQKAAKVTKPATTQTIDVLVTDSAPEIMQAPLDDLKDTATKPESATEITQDVVAVDEGPKPANKAAAKKASKAAAKAAPKKIDLVVDDNAGGEPSQTQASDSQANQGINPKFAHVLELSQQGKSVEEIAKELNMGKGEIMLILNLGGRRQNA